MLLDNSPVLCLSERRPLQATRLCCRLYICALNTHLSTLLLLLMLRVRHIWQCRYGMVLQQCAHFYNNIATEMIPCQKPLMLAEAVEFEKVGSRQQASFTC